MDTDESFCSTVLTRNERKKWDYLCRQQCSSARECSISETRWRSCLCINQSFEKTIWNPFDCSFLDHNIPINISTSMHVIEEVQASLLNAVKNGKGQMEVFVRHTFSESKRESFYSPISRSRVKTFGDMAKETKIKVQGQIKHGIFSSELVFRRALTLANCRQDVTLGTVLGHPVDPVPASMFHDDGTMRKCVKADLAHTLEDGVNSLVELNSTDKDSSVLIRDAMAIIQAIQTGDVKTFNDFEKTYFQNLVLAFEIATTVVDVFDRYDVANSVKVCERTRRAIGMQAGTGRKYNVIGGRLLPAWKKNTLSLLTRNLWLISYVITLKAWNNMVIWTSWMWNNSCERS